MSQLFSKIKVGNSSRSTFDLSHNQVTTSDFGYLIPICMHHMVPNDDFVVKPDIFCRLAPLAYPAFTPTPVKVRVHHFFVPYRLLYPHWDAFITQDESNQTIPPYMLQANMAGALSDDPAVEPDGSQKRGKFSRLMSNFGLNPEVVYNTQLGNDRFNAFPFLAYRRIWLDYYMDSNIYSHPNMVAAFNEEIKNGGALDGQFTQDLLETLPICYKKDYFTSAKLNPQKGSPSMVGVDVASAQLNPGLYNSNSSTIVNINKPYNEQKVFGANQSSLGNSKLGQFTIEALRAAASAQRYSERSNYVGSKLVNQLLAHFGIAPKAERIDMSEFLGGFTVPVTIGDVTSHATASTSQQLDSSGLGLQAGKGFASTNPKNPQSVRYHASEHGIFMSLMSILPDTSYYQGINRFWFKGTHGDSLDYYTPEFENLGFQEILNREVYVPSAQQESTKYQDYHPDYIFGYQPRYSEYKFQNDVLGGDFVAVDSNGNTGSPLDAFHLFRKLEFTTANPLALNSNFVELHNHDNDYDRIFQVTDNEFDHFYFSIHVDTKATRPMVGFAEPSLDSTMNQGDGNVINLPYGGTRL